LVDSIIRTSFFKNLDAVSLSSNNSNELLPDTPESQQHPSPGASTGSTTALSPDMLDNIENYLITTEINDSGKSFSLTSLIYFLISQVSVVKKVKNKRSM
jgi:hypothetical protein